MPIIPDDVRHIAALARLSLSEDEVSRFTGELSAILSYIEKLNKLDTANVMARTISGNENVMRDDVVAPFGDRRQILANAPRRLDDQWQVPGVMG